MKLYTLSIMLISFKFQWLFKPLSSPYGVFQSPLQLTNHLSLIAATKNIERPFNQLKAISCVTILRASSCPISLCRLHPSQKCPNFGSCGTPLSTPITECTNPTNISFFDQGIIDMNRNGNSANFFSYVCNDKKIKELFASFFNKIPISVICVSSMIIVFNAKVYRLLVAHTNKKSDKRAVFC